MEDLTPERWAQLEGLLGKAMKLPRQERSVFLHRACTKDPALRADIETLLVADAEAGSFLEEPAHDYAATLLSELWHEVHAETEPPGTRVGPYQIVREIGRGGMGQVFLAERADGQFAQQAALKLIKRGMVSEAVRHRFLDERQILAQLGHANIARLLDGGVSDEGRSYFVMEYIDGEPITAYCDRHRLPVEERLQLFVQGCEAVQYAHQNLVVHCDLKPSNMLVQQDGQVKLLDFGIARVLSATNELEQKAQPPTSMPVLTPEYAAPEQVRGTTVTTATDTYALGVLLYELLTAHRPYRITGYGPEELERVICQTQPERPSLAVGRTREQHDEAASLSPEAISQARSTSPEGLRRQLKGDLDMIVLKALRKEPEHRYQSTREFLEDIKRHLAGLPVQAQPDTIRYRAKKFVRRHRWGVLTAVMLAMLIVGFAVTMAMQQAQTALERDRAQQEAEKLTVVKNFLIGLFEASNPDNVEPRDITARELLSRGKEQIEALEEQPAIQAEMLHELGIVYRQMGLYNEAQPLLERSLALRHRLYGAVHLDVAASQNDLAWLMDRQGAYDTADSLYRQALTIRQTLLGSPHPSIAATLNDRGLLLYKKGHYDEAEQFHRQALTMRRNLLSADHEEVATSLNNLGLLLIQIRAYDEAEQHLREALAIRRKRLAPEHPSLVASLNNLGGLLREKKAYDEAEALYREALELSRKLLGPDHPNIATFLHNLGSLLFYKEDYDGAEQFLREALAMRQQRLGSSHPEVAFTLSWIARLLQKKENYDEAEAVYREALTMYRAVLGPEHAIVAMGLNDLGDLMLEQNRPAEALPLLREALAIRQVKYGETDPRTAKAKRSLGSSLAALTRYDEAEALLLASHAVFESPPLPEQLQLTRQALFNLYTAWGQSGKAAAYEGSGTEPEHTP